MFANINAALNIGSRAVLESGSVSINWWNSYPLLITFLIVLLTTAVLLFAAILTLIIIENRNHKVQIQILKSQLEQAYRIKGVHTEEPTDESPEGTAGKD